MRGIAFALLAVVVGCQPDEPTPPPPAEGTPAVVEPTAEVAPEPTSAGTEPAAQAATTPEATAAPDPDAERIKQLCDAVDAATIQDNRVDALVALARIADRRGPRWDGLPKELRREILDAAAVVLENETSSEAKRRIIPLVSGRGWPEAIGAIGGAFQSPDDVRLLLLDRNASLLIVTSEKADAVAFLSRVLECEECGPPARSLAASMLGVVGTPDAQAALELVRPRVDGVVRESIDKALEKIKLGI